MRIAEVIRRRLQGGGNDVNVAVAANIGERGATTTATTAQQGGTTMTDEQSTPEPREHELEDENGEVLPDREVMSIIDFGGPESGPGFTLPVEPPEKI